jgi:hypothetical protein
MGAGNIDLCAIAAFVRWYVDLLHAFGGSASVSQKFTTRVDVIERIGGRSRLGVPRPGFVNLTRFQTFDQLLHALTGRIETVRGRP